jgi:hypothetical protein
MKACPQMGKSPGKFFRAYDPESCQSFAVHVNGEPERFTAPRLDIKVDRGSYSRFTLESPVQYDDALRVILKSAHQSEGY